MNQEEFKTQVFQTAGQWKSGLGYRLEMGEHGGVSLYPVPAFSRWYRSLPQLENAGPLCVDECGRVYFINRDNHRLYRYNPETRFLEVIPVLGGCGADPGVFEHAKRILAGKYTLWALDTNAKKIFAFSKEHFQVKYIIDGLNAPVDFGVDTQGRVYILDEPVGNGNLEIVAYDIHGNPLDSVFDASCLKNPGFPDVVKEYDITVLDQESGSIYAVDAGAGEIRQFDPDGSYIGTISIPGFTGVIQGLAVDSNGDLYAGTSLGIAVFSKRQSFSKEGGVYYSKTLDSGIEHCAWHRLALNIDLPPRTLLKVYYYASDKSELKNKVDTCLSGHLESVQQKVNKVEGIIPWQDQEPEINPGDMLFREKTGRYLWLKLELSTYDETQRPAVSRMRLYYPRDSYLRYLPAIYQEDPAAKEFLERFLSIFESHFYDRETLVNNLFKYFDPRTAPGDFLSWLASWLNLALEEEWEEEKKRLLISEAYALYKKKGTPGGLKRFIGIYTGKPPVVLEPSGDFRPIVLNRTLRLGIDSILTRTPLRGFRLGMDSILGRAVLRDEAMSPEDPFLAMAHRFTVVLNLTALEYQRFEPGVRRILEEQKPAHTVYELRNIGEMDREGNQYVGINTYVSGYRPMRLGEDSILGTSLVVFDIGEKAGKVERVSRVGVDTLVI